MDNLPPNISPSSTGDKINEILESIGLAKNEIAIYLDLIKVPSSSALDISKRTGIHRSNTYDSLRKLIERGFVKEALTENKREFIAIEPEKIKDYLKQKQQEFDFILPQLKNFSRTSNTKESFSISEGVFAARETLLDLLNLNSPIFVYGASKEAAEGFGIGFLDEFHKNRIKKGIEMKHIYNKSAMDRINYLNKMKLTEARWLPDKYDTIVATVICSSNVIFFIFGKPLIIIKMVNDEIADAYKKYFEVLRKNSKI